MDKSSSHFLRLKKGDIIKVIKNGECLVGTVTYVSVEFGREVYDFIDQYGNFRWCYKDQITNAI